MKLKNSEGRVSGSAFYLKCLNLKREGHKNEMPKMPV
jgi:hypothetical protein